jgi:hypothetical protein
MKPSQATGQSSTIPYEQRLNVDLQWALREGSSHFANASAVHKTLRRLTRILESIRIPYAVAGDMAMFFHGFRKFTEIVEIVTILEGVQQLHKLSQRFNYLPATDGSMDLRDAELGVRIHFLLCGPARSPEMPFPINVPHPSGASVQLENMSVLTLSALLDLKLAWGMKGTRYLRQLADAQELIDRLDLPRNFADKLAPMVRDKFWELWADVRNDPCRGMY